MPSGSGPTSTFLVGGFAGEGGASASTTLGAGGDGAAGRLSDFLEPQAAAPAASETSSKDDLVKRVMAISLSGRPAPGASDCSGRAGGRGGGKSRKSTKNPPLLPIVYALRRI